MKRLVYFLLLVLGFNNFSVGQFAANSFAAKVDFATSSGIQGITMGDLNSDSKPEIITANITSGNIIRIFVNSSSTGTINNSSFTSFDLLTLSASPGAVKLADLNGDGKNEIVVGYNSSTNSSFSVFFNQYNGISFNSSSFARIDFSAGSNPQGLALADFDLDGKTDIAVSNYGSSNVYVFKNNSTLTTISMATAISYSVGSGPGSLTAGDIDNDGKVDLATANWAGGSISILRNSNSIVGNISFSSITTNNNTAVQTNPNWVTISDFNNNGLKEIICSNWGSNTISIYENVSNLTISLASRVDLSITPNQYPQANGVMDLDGDEKVDLALAVAGSTNILALKNTHIGTGLINSGSFSGFTSFLANTSPVGFVIGDLDNDGRPELVSGNYSGQNISIFKNRMISQEPTIQSTNLSVIRNINSISVNFLKGNGKKRLITCRVSNSSSSLPIDTNWYTSNDTFGLGSNLGLGNYVVYNDTGSSVTVKGLMQGQSYVFTIYEYNGFKGFSNYNIITAPFVVGTLGDVFYSKSTGLLNDTLSWGVNSDGSGTSPISFNNPNTTYIVTNNGSPNINANWIITGTGSSLKIGNGGSAINFTIPSGFIVFVDSISISSYATATFQGGLVSNKAFFDSLSTAQFISSLSQNIPGYNYYNIILAGGVKTLQNNIIIRNAFNMLASINTGSFMITVGVSPSQPGLLTRNGGVINGRLRRWFAPSLNSGTTGLFPIGNNSIYRPIQINFTSAPTIGGYITGEFLPTNPGNSGLPLYDFSISPLIEVNKASNTGFWRMDPTNIIGGQYTISMTGTSFFGITTPSTIRVLKRVTNGAWFIDGTAISGSGLITAPIVGRSGMQGFGEYTLAGDSTDNPLPLNWYDFQAESIENGVNLIWKTINEVNCKLFEIERNNSNSQFVSIGTLKANNQLKLNRYQWQDEFIESNEAYYYRIKQIDFDGKYTYSKEIAVSKFYTKNENVFFPNPILDKINCTECKNGSMVIYDAVGREYLIDFFNKESNIGFLPTGLYFIKSGSNSTLLYKK
ncbi:MAG: VCBS repeat-containing protein [bacterium]|nr:VCBS repeat-containing protein [bacterium]